MSQTCGELSQSGQTVSLLFDARGFTDAVGHQTHESLGQLRHLLHEFGKHGSRKAQEAAVCDSVPAHRKLLHPGKREQSGDVARLYGNYDGFAAELPSNLKLPVESHKHGICRITLARVHVPRLEVEFLRLAEEPGDLIVRQVRERRDAK